MRTIAFVTQRGGSGKSTLASSLAVAAREANETVVVIDMDPQGPLMAWRRRREFDDIAVAASGAARLSRKLAGLAAGKASLALIDTPGAAGPAFTAAVDVAELLVIPCRPSAFDLWASAQTRVALDAAGADYVFLLNQCPAGEPSARISDGIETLKETGALIEPMISARADYLEAQCSGLGVTERDPYGAAAAEIRALWVSISRRLATARPKRGSRRAA